ncbi:acyltransferase [Altererythrobacter sp. HHU K3-1]|uniref:Acyltransferase n=2 Tax=Qipengyuania atrilutea TaxID=2744473 RepID=A0A850H0M6_9SPHN|nr:acyltransferase [Actirhodobacter atriluteus]NVD43488.1 acyltransferase [Actirhodobacter atriluteus]
MRGVAAFLVVLYHANRSVPLGYLAVDLFFSLSGFVLCAAYLEKLHSGLSFCEFALVRFIRLAPLMIAGAAIGLAINGGSLWTLLLVPTGDLALYPANIPLWSLLFELVASLAFAALYRFGKSAWLLLLSFGAAGFLVGVLSHGSSDLGWGWHTLAPGLARTAFSFCIGVALFAIFRRHPTRDVSWLSVLAITVPVIIMIVPSRMAVYDLAIVAFAFPAIIWLGVRYEVPFARAAAFIGGSSYALYAIHHPIVRMDLPLWLTIPATVILAVLLERYYDRPMRTLLTRLRQVRATASVTALSGHSA